MKPAHVTPANGPVTSKRRELLRDAHWWAGPL